MKKFIVFATLLISTATLFAQISDKIYGSPAEYKLMAKRTMVVVTLEENEKALAKAAKDKKNPNAVKEYKEFIADYNTMMKDAVTNYWQLNTDIVYKTETEAKALQKEKSAKYVLLAYTELGDIEFDIAERSGIKVPALIYHRTDQKAAAFDYKIYLPSSYIRENDKYLPCDYKFALQQMQNNINWMIQNNKVLNFEDYAKAQMTTNCSKLAGKTLLVEKDFLYKNVTEAIAKENYGKKISFVDANSANESYVNETEGEAVLFSIPFGIIKGSMGPISSSALAFIKVIADSNTGEIYYIHLPKMGSSYVYEILKGEFGKMGECDN